jgi:hypothetical protein
MIATAKKPPSVICSRVTSGSWGISTQASVVGCSQCPLSCTRAIGRAKKSINDHRVWIANLLSASGADPWNKFSWLVTKDILWVIGRRRLYERLDFRQDSGLLNEGKQCHRPSQASQVSLPSYLIGTWKISTVCVRWHSQDLLLNDEGKCRCASW